MHYPCCYHRFVGVTVPFVIELSELNEAQLNELAIAAEALVLQVNDVRVLQDLRVQLTG